VFEEIVDSVPNSLTSGEFPGIPLDQVAIVNDFAVDRLVGRCRERRAGVGAKARTVGDDAVATFSAVTLPA
jgi:hypothetical protein